MHDENEDDLESEWGGRGGLDRAVTLFALEHISLRFHSPQKTFFQKYKKKEIIFSAIFLFGPGQLIYWFRPSFDNFRSRAGRPEREKITKTKSEKKWPCVRCKIFKKLSREKQKKMPKQRKSRNTGTVYERSAGRLAQGQVQIPQMNYFDAQR